MQAIDNFLNKMTMYRLVVYALAILVALGIVFAFMGHLSTKPTAMVVSLLILLISTYVTNRAFSWLLNIPTNSESWLITALILFLIIQPAITTKTEVMLAGAGVIAIASKFVLALNGKHIFNPAALAAAFMSLYGTLPTTWWVGSSMFWPFTLILGLAVVRKIRRFPLVLTFVTVSVVLQYVLFIHSHQAIEIKKHALVASPLIFLSTIMLTEPSTMPPRRNWQMVFGALVAILYVEAWKIGPLIIYPEVALLIGNLFTYAVSPKFRVRLQLKEIQKISDRVYNYIFLPNRPFNFLPGQYMEWTLAGVPYDSRGNRRTFTIASSPTEDEVHLGLKFYEPASTYKARFHDMKPGDIVYASQLAGNFTLKGHEKQKLVFVAGGIGITPFRSMLKYLSDNKMNSDIILIYVVSDPREFVYVKELHAARQIGVKVLPVVTDTSYQAKSVTSAKLSPDLLSRLVPDFKERTFYVSGPNTMVDATRGYLHDLGVHAPRIKTDHFSGY
jgi:ferredoxin-NADP reductase/Na+-translocating ferredoxin:NAD+ oxidoreductase RnfD subunit